MATATLPIHELHLAEVKAQKAKTETRSVVTYTGGRDDVTTQFQIIAGTLATKLVLGGLVSVQGRLILALQRQDFERADPDSLTRLAYSLQKMAQNNNELLGLTGQLGSEIRFWWRTSLRKIAEQSDHLESISESLHIAADSQSTAMLALAAEQSLERGLISGEAAQWQSAILR